MSDAWLAGDAFILNDDEYHPVTPVKEKKKRGKRSPGSKRMLNKKKRLLLLDPVCKYCKMELTIATATLDHVIPRSKGGKSNIENLVLACEPCNRAKGNNIS